jgi:hypothetical protein
LGYDIISSRPLEHDLANLQLIMHHPWRESIDDLKVDGLFAPALQAFMGQGEYPTHSAVAILRKKLK